MQAFTIVDGVVLALIAVSAILAYSRGLVRELLSIAGWVIAAIAAFVFAPTVEPLIREVPVLRDIIGPSCDLGILAGFAVVFALALVIVSIFTPLIAGMVQNSAIGPVDQGLGFLFGVARGVLLVAIALLVYDRVMGEESSIAMVDNSRSLAIFGGLQDRLADAMPEHAPEWLAAQYDALTRNCQ
jgi:membrane protein required for colicin V production